MNHVKGCVVGRAEEIKALLVHIDNAIKISADDQQSIVLHALQSPHLISIDTKQQIFLCAYKEPVNSFLGLVRISDEIIPRLDPNIFPFETVSLFHFNNRQSLQYYYT